MEVYLNFIGDIAAYFAMFLPLIYLKSFAYEGKAFRLFTIYLVFIGFITFSQIYCTRILKLESNIFLSHYYFIGQFIILSRFFKELIHKKWIDIVMGLVLVVLAAQYILQPEIYPRYNKFGIFFTHLILVFFALQYLYKSLGEKSNYLWINTGIILYFTTTSLIFYSGNLVFNPSISMSSIQLISDLNSILYLVFQILIFVEWWKNHSHLQMKS
jgi:hypothetical protein